MSSKLGFVLSLMFVALFFALGVDLINIEFAYTSLDSKATSISYRIAQHGNLESNFILSIESEFKVEFTCLNNCSPLFGDIVDYTISTKLVPLIVSSHEMTITLKRSAVIGFYQ